MATHGLAPAYVQIFYHSQWGPHVMTLQTRDWIPPASGTPEGSYTAWNSTNVDANGMVQGHVTLMKPDFFPTSEFDRYEIWTKETDTSRAVLRVSKSLGVIGTSAVTGWEAAVQKTYHLRTGANNIMKLVLLDSPSDNLFLKFDTLGSVDDAMISNLMSPTQAWAARADDQAIFFRDASVTINKILAKKYSRR